MALTNTNIEYLDKCWNFYTGCLHTQEQCPCADKCWARGMANRFGQSFKPTLHTDKLLDPLRVRKPSRIGVCFTWDLFGEWVDPKQVVLEYFDPPVKITHHSILEFDGHLNAGIFHVMALCPHHQFFFLTKNPAGLLKLGKFPDNAWVGATVCNQEMFIDAGIELQKVEAKHKWISFEPLIGGIAPIPESWFKDSGVGWIVIGGWSIGKVQPRIEWVKDIVEAADKDGIPVFLKDNLEKVLPTTNPFVQCRDGGMDYELRQELQEAK